MVVASSALHCSRSLFFPGHRRVNRNLRFRPPASSLNFRRAMANPSDTTTAAAKLPITHVIFDMDGLLLGNFVEDCIFFLNSNANPDLNRIMFWVRLGIEPTCRYGEVLHGSSGDHTGSLQQNFRLGAEGEDDGEEGHRGCSCIR